MEIYGGQIQGRVTGKPLAREGVRDNVNWLSNCRFQVTSGVTNVD